MDKILQRLQNMEDDVAILRAEVSTNKIKVETLQRRLTESQEKIERLEREKTATVKEKTSSKPGSMEKEVKAIKKQYEVVSKKCDDVSKKCEGLTKLQHVLNSFILKSRNPNGSATRIEGLRTDFRKLNQTVKVLQTKVTDSQKETTTDPVSKPYSLVLSSPVYCSSICRGMTIDQTSGILRYSSRLPSQPVGQFISAQPLTKDCPSFSFRIIDSGEFGAISIGVCPSDYLPNAMPGCSAGSIAYHIYDGGIYNSSGYRAAYMGEICTKNDIMECQLDFSKRTITFFKNGKKVFTTRPQEPAAFVRLYAAVGMVSVGETVQLLETEPWRP